MGIKKEKFIIGNNIRLSFKRFPNLIQNIITLISGQAISGEKPLFNITPLKAVFIDFSKLIGGIVGSFYIFHQSYLWWIILIIPYIFTVNGARSLASDAHYGAHGSLTGNKKIDFWLGEIISTIILSQDMSSYAKPHTIKHHGNREIASINDPDISLLFVLGFVPGKPIKWYWKRMFINIISPFYHFEYTVSRIKSNILCCPFYRILMTFFFHGILLVLIEFFGIWKEFIVAVMVPIILLVPISALLQFCSEHLWLSPRNEGESEKSYIRRLSHGRFCLFEAPPPYKSFIIYAKNWILWSIKMIYQVFCRSFILVSILPSHDYHHRKPYQRQWTKEHYFRQEDIDAGELDYTNYYNIKDVYNAVFENLHSLPGNYFDLKRNEEKQL